LYKQSVTGILLIKIPISERTASTITTYGVGSGIGSGVGVGAGACTGVDVGGGSVISGSTGVSEV